MSTLNPMYCRAFLSEEGCSFGRSCSLRHDIFKCSCGRVLLLAYRTPHTRGKNHQKQLAGLNGATVPQDRTPPPGPSRVNGNGYSHTNNGGYFQPGLESPQDAEPDVQLMVCEHCRKIIESSAYDAHVEDHMRQQRLDDIRAELDEAANDKEGVTVSARTGIDFGILDAETPVEVYISVTSTGAAVSLRSSRMRSSGRGDEHGLKFSARLRGKSKMIQKGMTRQVSVVLHPSDQGRYEDMLELVFWHSEKRTTFVITRTVEATIGSREDHELLKPKAPYQRRKFVKFRPVGEIVPSLRPPAWTKAGWVDKLPSFYPPAKLIDAAYGPRSLQTKQALANVKKLMPNVFNAKNYGTWFQNLLYIEEERVKLDLDAYSLTDTELKADHPRYKLLVKGLAENRPSVLVGDFILVSLSGSADTLNTRKWYEGRVHQVYENYVSLRFGNDFSTYRGTKFDVRFVLNRLPFRRMHQALANNFKPDRFLFPSPAHIAGVQRISQSTIDDIRPFDRPIGEDEEQMETVAAIVNQKPGSVPFVVFGPPGTGKTVTIVEAMQQLLDRDPNVRILACAPNNSAADTITMKLSARGKSEIFRLNAMSRRIEDIPKSLREFSLMNDNKVFAMPTAELLVKYRVVISTCLSAGVPAGLGLKRGHFTHIFIDEAGQGKEPEIMVPILSIADSKTNVVLAGDNQQLGPIVHSNLASSLGLKTSYLSRIMEREIYNLETGRGITIVKLVKNFRSHPDILRFSNEEFYKSELVACGDRALIHSLDNYEELPKKSFPVIFHGIVGKDEREASSPSFFNIVEATQVKKYVMSLIGNRKKGIRGEHIGVITPYHAQRCKILDLLYKEPKFRDIKVGSVEEFQGQERRVIIISTVRSNKDFVTSDIKRSLGFVANKNRMNVALTRAQALLIVIGNPVVLSLDPLWRGFLNFVYMRGGWRGKNIDWNPQDPILPGGEHMYGSQRKAKEEGDMEETLAQLRALILQKHGEDGFEIDLDDDDDDEDDAAAFERPILREVE